MKPKFLPLLILLSLLLAACGTLIPAAPTPTLPPSETPAPTATLTPIPSATPTPLPPLGVLLAGPEADPALATMLQDVLYEPITQAGLRWQVRQRLEAQDLDASLRLVVALPPDPGLDALAAAAPQTQFLAFGIPGLAPAPNLTSLGAQGERIDQQGFIAGLIAAMITPEYRVGVISIADSVEGRSARTGFLNGVTFFCGLCTDPRFSPPYYGYPLYFELNSSAVSAEWQAAANYMVDHMVKTVYVYPGAGDAAMLELLATSGVNIISGGVPAEALQDRWVASLGTDPLAALQEVLPQVLNGQSGGELPLPLQISQVNPDLFSPGKQASVDEVLAELLAGYIDTGVDPATGESRWP